jgi:undecaprenyl-diphosphatase
MEDLLRVIVLALVQGISEFLPVSSSGHLIVVRELFGWSFEDELTLDVALHLGTTLAVLTFFWREWLHMSRDALSWALCPAGNGAPRSPYNRQLLALLAIGSLPAVAAGLAFEVWLESELRSVFVVGAMLVVFGLVLLAADRLGRQTRTIMDLTWRDAIVVGIAQALALIPGVSRSGATISAALARNYARGEAARFSFLLSTPVIVGAGVLELARLTAEGTSAGEAGTMLVGATVAAISGWLTIRFLLRLIQLRSYASFVVYRLVAGVFVLTYFSG